MSFDTDTDTLHRLTVLFPTANRRAISLSLQSVISIKRSPGVVKWLACYTQEQIAEEVGVSQWKISDFIGNGNSAKFYKIPDSEHQTDFTIPLYNIWKQQKKTNQVNHFGNTEATLLDNLLYLCTSPFDIVIDPFAGGGSTIDVCTKRSRRYWVSDRQSMDTGTDCEGGGGESDDCIISFEVAKNAKRNKTNIY